MTAARKVVRDDAIVAAIRTGEKAAEVAERYDLSPAQVRKIVKAYERVSTGLDDVPMEIVEGLLRSYARQARAFLALAEENVDRMPAVALAALRGHQEALRQHRDLMADIGKLPSNLALLRSEAALERLAEEMMDVMERVDSGELPAGSALRELDRIRGVKLEPIELGPGDVRDDV